MYHLHRPKTLISLFFCMAISTAVLAQSNQKNYNYLTFKRKSHYFGLTLGYNHSSFKIEHSNRFINNGDYRINESGNSPGLTLCMITNFKIGDYFDFRVLPSITLVNRSLQYIKNGSSTPKIVRIESVFGEMPLLLRFTSSPYKDKRVFVTSGIKYTYDFSSNSRSDRARFAILRISPHDFQYEIGAGLQFYLPYFIFSPEIKFSHGINNLLIYDKTLLESTVVEKLFSQGLTISLHFEG